jgi:DHA1 family bicyclomycin/chloramphenicol resistance-like MFS transporter
MKISERALIVLLAACTGIGPVALNVYLPVLPQVQTGLGVSVAQASVTVTAPLIAFAIGLLFYGPLSDRVGRRPVILFGIGVCLVGSTIAMLAPNVATLTAGRVIQALGTSAGITVARATMGDLFPREKMAKMIAYLTMVMVMANAVAPIVGGALGEWLHWRAVFALVLAAAATIGFYAWRLLPETRDVAASGSAAQVVRAAATLAGRPAFLGYILQSGVIYATFLVFISLMPYVFVRALGHTTTEYGVWYLCIAGGYFLGNWHVTRYATRVGVHRLLVAGVAFQATFCSLAWALAAYGHWHAAWIFLPWFFVAYGQGLALPNITANAVALAPQYAGAASGLLGFSQQLVGALSAQWMALAPTDTPVPVATFCGIASLVAFAGVLAQPSHPPPAPAKSPA